MDVQVNLQKQLERDGRRQSPFRTDEKDMVLIVFI